MTELVGLIEQFRLVTLVGAPGCGKTRLGVELGERLVPRFREGVYFVDLAGVSDPAQVVGAVGLALGIEEEPGTVMADRLARALAGARLLIVLDNCEHVVGEAAALARHVLLSCREVRILATSRVPLGLHGEQVWAVSPLDVPTAAALFADRARLVFSRFEVDEASEAAVEEICRRLDGLPLAIELAAAWSRVLSPAQIVDRLDEALPLLDAGAHGLAPRQATMDATVEWSYRLLEPHDQRLFDRLSAFVGGFDLAAAESVAAPGEPADAVLRGVRSLVEHSLVLSDSGAGGRMRYRLLEPVRQCGSVRLATRGESEAMRQRHAEHYLTAASWRLGELRAGRRAAALSGLDEDKGNFVAALRWAQVHSTDLGLQLCTTLARLWEERGWVNEASAWLEAMLDARVSDEGVRASALALAGRLAWRQWDYEQAHAWLEASLVIERRRGNPLGVARRLRDLALVAMSEGDDGTAAALCKQSISRFRDHEDEHGLASALTVLGLARYIAGDPAAGDDCMRQAVTIGRATGEVPATAAACLGLAYSAHVAGHPDDERAHMVAAVDALRASDGLVGQPDWLVGGAALAVTEGRFDAALRLAGALEALGRHRGNRMIEQLAVPFEPQLERARQQLGAVAAARLMDVGAHMPLDALVTDALAEPSGTPAGLLTPREQEVADLVARGLTNVQIAQELYISKRTVESHVEHIKQKLGVDTRQQVIALGAGMTLSEH